jgi:hypothetical protein
MTTLAANEPRAWELGDHNELPIIASDIIYQGAAVGDNASGYMRPLVAGDPFRGFALEKCDNASGGAGAKNVKLLRKGKVSLSISGLAITDVGKDVYASDDDTFVLTIGTNTRIGYVYRYVSAGVGIVAFRDAEGVEVELTDSTGGAASDTLANVVGVDVAAAGPAQVALVSEVENITASLAAKINYLLRKMGN